MNKLTIAIVAGLLGVAAVLGTVAATRTVSLGTAHRHSADAVVRARTQQLDRFEASLRRALAKTPPTLPALPKASTVAISSAAPAPAAAPQQRVVYRRPPPIVVVKHTHHGDDGSETYAAGGDEGGGGGD